ncbi:hypothetical protein [Flavobacterium sp. 38-13]|nr:hypothetical protein [Flavobacterium sp. 38-13]
MQAIELYASKGDTSVGIRFNTANAMAILVLGIAIGYVVRSHHELKLLY